jgi:hypothetical protein
METQSSVDWQGRKNYYTVATTIWNFRLVRLNRPSNPLPPLDVEMRGQRFAGQLYEGDKVHVLCPRNWTPGLSLCTSFVYCLASGGVVYTDKHSKYRPYIAFSKRVQFGVIICILIAFALLLFHFAPPLALAPLLLLFVALFAWPG